MSEDIPGRRGGEHARSTECVGDSRSSPVVRAGSNPAPGVAQQQPEAKQP